MRLCMCVLAMAMIGNARAEANPKDPAARLLFVLLEKPALPAAENVISAYRDRAGDGAAKVTAELHKGKKVLSLDFADGTTAHVALMPVAVPNGEADAPFEFSVSSMSRGAKLRAHRAHLVVFVSGAKKRSIAELTSFTHLIAAIVETSPAVGVYWADAGVTHDARTVLGLARGSDPGDLLPLWTGIEIVPDGKNRLSLLTLGMRRQLGAMDLRITAPQAKGADAVELAFVALAYALERGSPVPDGDTFGRSEKERLKVRHEPSPLKNGETVWRVDLP
jgi:hypothetical protein